MTPVLKMHTTHITHRGQKILDVELTRIPSLKEGLKLGFEVYEGRHEMKQQTLNWSSEEWGKGRLSRVKERGRREKVCFLCDSMESGMSGLE